MKKNIENIKINSQNISKEVEKNSNLLLNFQIEHLFESKRKLKIFDAKTQGFVNEVLFDNAYKYLQNLFWNIKHFEDDLKTGIKGNCNSFLNFHVKNPLSDRLNINYIFLKSLYLYRGFHMITDNHKLNNLIKDQSYVSKIFEKYRKHSPFLFHLKYIEDSESILHIMNLKTNVKFKIPIYKRNFTYFIDCEQHYEFIFICGGYFNSRLNTCFLLNLASLPKIESSICILKESLSNSCLVSTRFHLFMIGGNIESGLIAKCEKYSLLTKEWDYTKSLNNAQGCSTSLYIYPSKIYVFGSFKNNVFEFLGLNHNGDPDSEWKILKIENSNERSYGIALQVNLNEILIFGGYGINSESFFSFDIAQSLLVKKNEKFVKKCFYSSKPRIFNEKVYIACSDSSYFFKVDIRNLSFEEYPLTF